LLKEQASEPGRPAPELEAVAQHLGFPLSIRILGCAERPLEIWLEGPSPRLRFGVHLEERGGAPEWSFLLGLWIGALTEGCLPARLLGEQEFEALLGKLNEALKVRSAEEPGLAERLSEGLESCSTEVLRRGLETYSQRLALALSLNFGGAMGALRLLAGEREPHAALGREALGRFFRENDTARDLLRFASTPACLKIRAWREGEL